MSTRTQGHWDGFDVAGLWSPIDHYRTAYTEPAPSDELLDEVERELGVRLPDSYVELARSRNGGGLARGAYPVDPSLGLEDDLVEVVGLYAIGRTAPYSLLGDFSTAFWQEEWGYPDLGVVVANTPTGGHDLVMLDYRACGSQGEPSVVHVDQAAGYQVRTVAPDLVTFVRGLVDVEALLDG